MAIPIFWNLLDKAGNASAKEHQAILKRFTTMFGKDRIEGILADREFGSGELFEWLNNEKIPFYIRVKEGSLLRLKKKRIAKAKQFFSNLRVKEKMCFPMTVELFGQKVSLEGSRSEKGELMIIATNEHPKNAVSKYLRRWEIENLFSCLKGRGFRFEETHVTKLERIEKLMALLVVGFAWAHKIGEWRAAQKPIRFNKHKESTRPQSSYFRYGYDLIRDCVVNLVTKRNELMKCLQQIAFPYTEITAM